LLVFGFFYKHNRLVCSEVCSKAENSSLAQMECNIIQMIFGSFTLKHFTFAQLLWWQLVMEI